MSEAREARDLALRVLGDSGARWSHIQGVARMAERILDQTQGLDGALVDAAWLHDVGYAAAANRSGFHSLDGALFLADEGWPSEIVSLVAYHTGAEFEAEERGLADGLMAFARPDSAQLDALTLADLSVSPFGRRMHPSDRIAEILTRYGSSDPVYRAVTRSRTHLMDCAERAAEATGSPHEWGFTLA